MRALTLALLVGHASLAAPPATLTDSAPVRDIGIFSDLDGRVKVALPPRMDSARTGLRIDDRHGLLVLFEGELPVKAYALSRPLPAGGVGAPAVLAHLDPGDAAELRAVVSPATPVHRVAGVTARAAGDEDGDGIPDQLDALMGARKLVLNQATYTEGYFRISFPGGDVPRGVGVCSDTIIRAYRNAGIDLQRRVADDIRAAPAAYGWITHPNPSIDHRRVKTLLTWFARHVPEVHGGAPRAGDVVFLDTFPNRPGPDHVGIISDRMAPSGMPYVINNWTVGYREGEMDLLSFVPVTHQFRAK
jgi:uncharacterized protein YijF (DUF1287 family)